MKTSFTYLFAAILGVCISVSVFAQTPAASLHTKNKKSIALYQQAEMLQQQRKFNEALNLLNNLISKDPAFPEPYFKAGSLFLVMGNKAEAKKYFCRGADLMTDVKAFAGAYYTAGELSYGEGEYEKAKQYYKNAAAVQPNDKRILDQVPVNIKKCDTALYFVAHPVAFNAKEMPAVINAFYIHSHPVLTADQQTIIYTKRNGIKITDDEDIVISTLKNGVWSVPQSISDSINTKYNEGACTMSADGKTLVFIACPPAGSPGSCDLFISYKKGDVWGTPVGMGKNVNSPAWDSEPTLSADGKTLYFASDRSGGYGKEDLYVTYCDDQMNWSMARNLGKSINTSGREVSPCIHADGKTLYFSSNNYPGLGGFDIYYSQKADSSWASPINIGYPINTYLDDATLFISVDSKKGYYSKYDKGNVNSKSLLYVFDVPESIQQKQHSTYAKGHVYDAVSKSPVAAKIELIDLATNKVVQSVRSGSKNGDYTIVLTEGSEYALYVSSEGYLFESSFFDFKKPAEFNALSLDVYLKKASAGASVVLNNIFFATNSAVLEDKSKTELQKLISLMNTNPSIRVELSGYTDNVGQEAANLKLSAQRAKSVYDYLIQNGIQASRLIYKGYASAKPVADNNTEEGRQKNRRLEIKVL